MTSKKLVVGIGSPFGSDRFGWQVVELLARRLGATGKVDGGRLDLSVHAVRAAGATVAGPVIAAAGRDDLDVRLLAARHPTDVLDALEDVDELILCDACRGSGSAGALHRWNWPSPQLPDFGSGDTHGVGLASVLMLAERLGRLPVRVTIWAADFGDGSTGPLEFAEDDPPHDGLAQELAERLWEELRDA